MADFLRNAKLAGRRFHAPLFGADTETGTRDWVRPQRFVASLQGEPLIADGNVELCLRALHEMQPAVKSLAE